MPSDQELVARALGGDAQAFETLFVRHKEAIGRHIARIVHNDAATQDLLQETFMRVWTHGEQWHGQGSFKAWLYRIASNLALNHLRSTRRRREQPLEIKDDWELDEQEDSPLPAWMVDVSAPGPDAAVDQSEQRRLIRRLVEGLPQDKRQAFHLVHEMEMSMQDAADELGIPQGTVKSRLYYAKRHLANEWRELQKEWEEF